MTLSTHAELSSLLAAERYDDVLSKVAAIEAAGYVDARLLVVKATAIQMGETDGYELADAKRALETAAAMTPADADAQLELGWFLYNVEDDATAAKAAFDAALVTLRGQITSGIEGLVKSIRESTSDDAAADALANATARIVDIEALTRALQE